MAKDWPVPNEKEPSRLVLGIELILIGGPLLYGYGSMIYGGFTWLTSLL